ncbi:MAG: CPBP family intramembrane metalloprotease [Clostridia bacterium]|nr:CPBP family intramembrane metalloprotease [Clostridia bacterium]
MVNLTNQEKFRPWMGFVFFAALMVFFLTVCQLLQYYLGMAGLILTELLFLGIAVGYCLIRKVKIKEMFPIRKPKVREVFGCLLLMMGGQSIGIVVTALTSLIFPSSNSTVTELNDFLYGNGLGFFALAIFIAVLPAICEEAVHRGAILSHFRGIKKDWVIVLIMGIFFGLNHVSVLRFGVTAILGAVLTFAVVKSNNMLLSMLMHLGNNLFSVIVGYFSAKSGAAEMVGEVNIGSYLGVYLIMACTAPILLTLGAMLLDPKNHRKIRFLFAGIIAGVMFLTGSGLMLTQSFKRMNDQLLNATFGYTVTEENKESEIDFTVEEEREVTVMIIMVDAKGDYKVEVVGDKEGSVYSSDIPKGLSRTINTQLVLPPDHYTIRFIGEDNAVGEEPFFTISVS